MRMLKLLRLAVFVVCIAAFASGCGGGGGGGDSAQMPVMECPQGQVGTYPDCTDPGPTDEQRIASSREAVAGIVTDAGAIEQSARAAVTAVEASADATDEQIASARAEGNAALDAYRAIVRASGVANAATTPEAAEGAVANARAALSTLSNAQAAAAAIQSAVNAVAGLREQQEEEDRLATNGSSLIQHVRDNKKVYDAVLSSLGPGSITVGTVTDTAANGATYPYHTGGTRTVYPQPQGTERGVLGVTVTVGTTPVSSTGLTPKLSGTGRLTQGLDMKNSAGTLFVNAYTDIAVDGRASTGNSDTENTPADERYEYDPDPDYLLAGIWLDDSTTAPSLGAFAYGNENITTDARARSLHRCTATQETLPNTCAEATGFHEITNFVSAGKELTATYRGGASGAYLAGGLASYFTADVELTAVFRNVDDTNVTGSNISGEVTNITAGGKSIEGSIDLIRHTFSTDNIGGSFETSNVDPAAVGVIAGENYSGRWTGQFFGKRTKGSPTALDNTGDDGRAYTYQPDAPNSVAGAFYVIKQSAPAGDAAFLGSFAAHR